MATKTVLDGVLLRAEIKGLEKAQEKAFQVAADVTAKLGTDISKGLMQATVLVWRDARKTAPADTDRLRASITMAVETPGKDKIRGVVGSNLEYAPYMELGTGVYAGRTPYFPPPKKLERWARRHGFSSGYAVALAIFKAGGTKPRKYLQNAFNENLDRIKQLVHNIAGHIATK